MLRQYLKLTLGKKNIFSFIKLNIFPSILEIFLLFILPALIKKHHIVGQYEAITINSIFLFFFELSVVFISRHSLNIWTEEKKHNNNGIFLKALFFVIVKTMLFILFLYLFKKAIKLSLYLAFLLCFFSIFFFLCLFYLPCLLVKNSFAISLKRSIYLYISNPFFTFFVFLHSMLIFFISMLLLNLYPGVSKIMCNIHMALRIMEEKNLAL
jgi:membrane protein